LKKIDELLTQATRWTCDIVTSPGNQLTNEGEPVAPERLELWRQDPVECMKKLMGNPIFKNSLEYALQKHFMEKWHHDEHRVKLFVSKATADTSHTIIPLPYYLSCPRCTAPYPYHTYMY
jgi:hypothetical protein